MKTSRLQTLSELQPADLSPYDAMHAPGEEAGARGPPRWQNDHLSYSTGQNIRSRIDLLAPLPGERKPAIGTFSATH